jgi:hypothetical protein
MHSQFCLQSALVAAMVTVGCAVPALAESMLPQPVHEGDVTYITGGIGADETQALEASAGSYDLQISNAEKNGDFTAGTDLVIWAKNGREVLQARNTGPLLYAQLPPGDYVIDATYKGVERVRDAKVGGKGATGIHLIWQQED